MGLFDKRGSGRLKNVASLNEDPEAALLAISQDEAEQSERDARIRKDIKKMIDQGTASIMDLWAPPRLKILSDHVEFGEQLTATYTISSWANELQYGFLMSILESPDLMDIRIDKSFHIHPVKKELAIGYNKDKHSSAKSSAMAEYDRKKVKAGNQKLYSKQMESSQYMLDLLENGNENMFQVSLLITIYGENQFAPSSGAGEPPVLLKSAYDDLIEKTNRFKKVISQTSSGGFAVKPLLHQQRDALKASLPFGYGGIHAFQNFTTSSLATCFPFTKGSLQVDEGVLYGLSLTTKQPIFFDVFNSDWMESYNTIIIGTKGSGKSALAKTLLGRYALRKTQIFVLDPALSEGGGEYVNLATSLDGTVIDFGGANGVFLNPFSLVPPSDLEEGATVAQTAEALFIEKKQFLAGMFDIMRRKYLNENPTSLNLEALSKVTSELVSRTYQFKRVNLRHWDFSEWVPERMPTLSDYAKIVDQYIKIVTTWDTREKILAWGQSSLTSTGALKNRGSAAHRVFYGYLLSIQQGASVWGKEELSSLKFLKQMLSSYLLDPQQQIYSPDAAIFNGTKQVDFSNPCIVFRLSNVSQELKPLASYLMFDLINSRIRSSSNTVYTNKIVAIDEAWKIIDTPAARAYIEALCREGRKNHTGLWFISQSYEDFQNDNKIFSKYANQKIIMRVPSDEADQLIDDIGLSSSMASVVDSSQSQLGPGYGVLHLDGHRKSTTAFYCAMSQLEAQIADTTSKKRPPMTKKDFMG